MKYLFIILEVQDGERAHTHKVLHTTHCKNTDFAAQYYAAHFWGYSSNIGISKSNPLWEVEDSGILISLEKVEELNPETFKILENLFSY